jgi:hypothetical protein
LRAKQLAGLHGISVWVKKWMGNGKICLGYFHGCARSTWNQTNERNVWISTRDRDDIFLSFFFLTQSHHPLDDEWMNIMRGSEWAFTMHSWAWSCFLARKRVAASHLRFYC